MRSSSSAPNLFVENFQSICEYTLDGRRVRVIKNGFTQEGGTRVGGLTFDPSGYLYAITGDFSVSVYTPTSRKLVRILTDGIGWPFSLTTDAKGNLYVGNGENDSVAVFAPGASSPSNVITQGIADPTSLAIDSKGNLYVANLFGNSVTVYAPDGVLLRTITAGTDGPETLALDGRDELYVGDAKYGYGRTVTIYAPPNDDLVQTISQDVYAPWAVAVDSKRRLYVSDANSSRVAIYSRRRRNLKREIRVGKEEPAGLALDSSNQLYLAVLGHPPYVAVYAPGSDTPKYKITKGVVMPLAIALGPP